MRSAAVNRVPSRRAVRITEETGSKFARVPAFTGGSSDASEMIEGGAGRCSNQDQPAKSEDDLRRDVDGIGPWADKNGEKDSADQHSAPHDVFGAVSPHNFSRNQGVSGVGKGTDQTEKQGRTRRLQGSPAVPRC